MTLLELMIALVLMAMVVALVSPSWRVSPGGEPELAQVVRRGGDLAARRGEVLILTVERNGAWRLVSPLHDDGAALLSGVLPDGTEGGFVLELTDLGACLPRTPLPASLAGWDASRCAVDSLSVAAR